MYLAGGGGGQVEVCHLLSRCSLIMLLINIIMLHVYMNKLHARIFMLRVDITFPACRGQKYTTILFTRTFMKALIHKLRYYSLKK